MKMSLHRLSAFGKRSLLCAAVFAQMAVFTSRAAVTVTGQSVPEGTGAPASVVFTISLTQAEATPRVIEYATVSGTAIEGVDYEGKRGAVTIPAGELQAQVTVPVIADNEMEDDESFALAVWPQGGVPVPALAPIPAAPLAIGEDRHYWNGIEGSVPGSFLLFTHSDSHPSALAVMRRNGNTISTDGVFKAPSGGHQFAEGKAFNGRWLAATDGWPSGINGDTLRLHLWERGRVTPNVWTPLTPIVLPRTEGFVPVLAMSGPWLAVAYGTDNAGPQYLRVYELIPGGPPREVWNTVMPVFGRATRQMIMSGRHLITVYVASSDPPGATVDIFEAQDEGRTDWKLVHTKTGYAWPVLFEGERFIINGGGKLNIFGKNEGGPNQWGKVTDGPALGHSYYSAPEARGQLLMIGEPGEYNQTPSVKGSVRAYAKNPAGNAFPFVGSFVSPVSTFMDGFGRDVALSGLDMATLRQEAILSDFQSWAGRLEGAEATLLNDDLPVLKAAPGVFLEPHGAGAAAASIQVVLSRAAAAPVSMAWRTVAVTATPGSDYVESTGTLTIPAGQWQGRVSLAVFPDNTAEQDESLRIEFSNIAGATPATVTTELVIRDATPVWPVVAATATEGYEDAAPVYVRMRMWASPQPVQLPWRSERIHKTAGFDRGLGVAGDDFQPASGLFSAVPPFGSELKEIPVLHDDLLEGDEEFSALIALPGGFASASWAQRVVHPLERDPLTSTDGNWVAASDIKLLPNLDPERGDVILFRRDSAAPGGWTEHKRLNAAGIGGTVWRIGWLGLRNGILAVWDIATSSFLFFEADAGGPGLWGLHTRLPAVPSESVVSIMAFDGRTLLIGQPADPWHPRHFVEVVEKNLSGQWGMRTELDTTGLSESSLITAIDGNVAVLAGRRIGDGSLILRIFELDPGAQTRWRKLPDLRIGANNVQLRLKLNRGLIAANMTGPSSDNIQFYRRGSGGTWALEATLEATGLQALDRGVVLASGDLWARTDSSPGSWQMLSSIPGDWTSVDLNEGVMTGTTRTATDTTSTGPAAFIAGPGARCVITDAAYVNYGVVIGQSVSERTETTELLRCRVRASKPLHFPVQIPWHTVDVTATSGQDYIAGSGVVTVPPGDASGLITIPILADQIPEPTEQFKLVFGKPSYGGMEPMEMQISIYNAQIPVTMPAGPFSFPEPSAGEVTYMVPVKLPYPLQEAMVCNCAVGAGTATAADVRTGTIPVNVPAGSSVLLLPVTVLADGLSEGVETLTVTPFFPTGFSVASNPPASIPVRIDDGIVPGLTPHPYTLAEGETLTVPVPGVLEGNTRNYVRARLVQSDPGGTLALLPDGSFTFTPPPNFIGKWQFSYQASASSTELFPAGNAAVWRWLHPVNGQDPGIATPGFQVNWKTPAFDDTAWRTGTGLMGYGTIGPNQGLPITTNIGTPNQGQRFTAYFRLAFQAPENPPDGITMEFICDDGAIFYLNGVEAGRFFLPPGGAFATDPDTYTLLTPTFAADPDEPVIRTLTLPATAVSGTNVLAVSLHNQSVNSSDLAFRLHSLTVGGWSTPMWETITVTDAKRPPVLMPDTFEFSFNAPADSRALKSGGLFANDGLFSKEGVFFDPVLEVSTGGSPPGPVVVDPATGHFRMTLPQGFFGAGSFNYRVRDKDGWSEPVAVNVNFAPSSPLEEWRAQHFGPSSSDPEGEPFADPDRDGTPNFLEYVTGADPERFEISRLLTASFAQDHVELVLRRRSGVLGDVTLFVESAGSLQDAEWQTLAVLNDYFGDGIALGVVRSQSTSGDDTIDQFELEAHHPDSPEKRFYRVRASLIPPWWRP
ncbi:MAG TPA: Calx-beta domain-containing protein [Verrucomicrobiales bacterium]|nr:Calx-beta domain-containing protein [Verrucomicrobiales bacterium]